MCTQRHKWRLSETGD